MTCKEKTMTYQEYIKSTTRKERMGALRAKVLRFVLLIGTVCALAVFLMIREARGDVSIPETTPEVNKETVYAKGEGAYAIVSEAREARLYVGGDNGEALAVVDASAIRGEVNRVLQPVELFYDHSDNVVQTGDGAFRWDAVEADCTAGKEWLRIIARDGGKVDYIRYGDKCLSAQGGIGASVDAVSSPYGNAYQIGLRFVNASRGSVAITNIVAYRTDESTRGNLTDATLNKYTIKDSVGRFDLGLLRQSYNTKIDKVAGYRWSEFPASNAVRFANMPTVYDTNGTFFAKAESGSFGLYAGGARYMSVAASGGDSKYSNATEIRFTQIDTNAGKTDGSESTVTLKVKVAHTGTLDESALVILTCNDLGKQDGMWYEIPYTKESSKAVSGGTEYTLTVAKRDGADRQFYKAAYGTLGATALVQFNSPVQFNNGLRIRGDDGNIYRISVKNGTLSATVVND